MILQIGDTRMGKDKAGQCIGAVLVALDDDVYKALAAAVEVAYDDPESTPPEYAAAAKELWSFFHGDAE